MAPKTLAIHGDADGGKKTLAGHLVLSCGANLPDIELIERNKVRDLRGITASFRQQEKPMLFYGPSSQYSITDQPNSSVKVLLWVVDATSNDKGKSSCERLESFLSLGELRVEEQLIVVVNKMDLKDWSEKVFTEIAQVFSKIGPVSFRVSIVPLSSLQGDNMLELFPKAKWLEQLVASRGVSNFVVAQPLLLLL